MPRYDCGAVKAALTKVLGAFKFTLITSTSSFVVKGS